MFRRILWGSLRRQRARLSIVALAIGLGSALVSGLLNLSGDISGQVGRELRAYGANIIIRPRTILALVGGGADDPGAAALAQTIAIADLEAAGGAGGVATSVPYLYSLVQAQGRPVVLLGVDQRGAQQVNPWWRVEGRWAERDDEIVVGVRAAAVLGLAPDDQIALSHAGRERRFRVVGLLQTGGAEDEQLLAGLGAAQTLTGQPGQASLMLVSALGGDRSLDSIVQDLQARLPAADVRPLAQVARAETEVVHKVRLLIGLVAALVLLAGMLTAAGTLSISVFERRAEIGLMKALGANDRRVAGVFLAEAAHIGLGGGALGYLAGLGLAVAIGRQVFQTTISPALWVLPATILIALGVVLAASLLPVRQALAVDPITTLRGE
jgi:putative ABC transport system permease protein